MKMSLCSWLREPVASSCEFISYPCLNMDVFTPCTKLDDEDIKNRTPTSHKCFLGVLSLVMSHLWKIRSKEWIFWTNSTGSLTDHLLRVNLIRLFTANESSDTNHSLTTTLSVKQSCQLSDLIAVFTSYSDDKSNQHFLVLLETFLLNKSFYSTDSKDSIHWIELSCPFVSLCSGGRPFWSCQLHEPCLCVYAAPVGQVWIGLGRKESCQLPNSFSSALLSLLSLPLQTLLPN